MRPFGLISVGPLHDAGVLAEGVGFEPTAPCGAAVFKTAALNHSATPPRFDLQQLTRPSTRGVSLSCY